ncbi:MAG TPA: thiamine phosphate synthase [Gammaproteobacteria bacterium]
MKTRPPLKGIYAITAPELTPGRQLFAAAELALRGGVALLQYRDKTASPQERLERAAELQKLCICHGVPLIINDDVMLAKKIGAAGVHLGGADATLAEARTTLGSDSIIGVSCYNRLELAGQAAAVGANYIAFGSVYYSPTKPHAVHAPRELFKQAKRELDIAVCAIGGINVDNAAPLLELGVDLLAVISGIFAQNDIESAARRLVECVHLHNP